MNFGKLVFGYISDYMQKEHLFYKSLKLQLWDSKNVYPNVVRTSLSHPEALAVFFQIVWKGDSAQRCDLTVSSPVDLLLPQ